MNTSDLLTQTELERRAAELSRPAVQDEERGGQDGLLVLRLGGESHGLPVAAVREVLSRPQVTPLPLAPSFLAGLLNLRGEIVAALDLRALLGIEPAGEAGCAVVVRHGALEAALLVEEASEVVWARADQREAVVATVPHERAPFFYGAYRIGSRLITAVEVSAVLRHPGLAAFRRGDAQ